MPAHRVVFRALTQHIQQLAENPVLSGAHLLSPSDDWVAALREPNVALGLIEVTGLSASEQAALESMDWSDACEVIFFSDGTPNRTLDTVCLKSGGFHFRSPVAHEAVVEAVADILADLETDGGGGVEVVSSDLDQFGLLAGSSRVMRKLYRSVRKVASAEANVLIVGESGVGKELVANTLHLASPRAANPFVAINCSALSPELVESELFGHVKGAFTGAQREHQGVFAQAEGGTLFLDEITEMPLDQQAKLLRVLETGEYRPLGSQTVATANVRVISATNRDPEQAIDGGFLREDVYFRLAQFPIYVPPLRARGADIAGLARHFLAYRNAEDSANKTISEAALAKLADHTWPGNVRELKHALERAFILADTQINVEHVVLDDSVGAGVPASSDVPAGVPLEDIERMAIENTLAENEGNKVASAKQLGISVKTLYNKLEKYQAGDDQS
ncbi:sigma-54 interaction domain-containing protein [Simiduia aestuariiviva]|uniref:DNA-binding NtrC family response regulator n=1 Tax=Simiduia aestuariiviva TaxID=1510459 RepID=A0A839UVN6_9GAMM|nr:sigma-54 dependent transcriptional regulator [Simiduia aestuariiviva]MBB3169427.1 DNA-binding NtrC family response regulator [Simiduia aestuariiviva]